MIATTIEQSKRLLELGLKSETADMRYDIISENQIDGVAKVGYKKDVTTDCIPAWSLSALLELMPYTIELCKESPVYVLGIYRISNGYAIDYWNSMNGDYAVLYRGESLFDVVVRMVKWLLENKHLKV